MKLEELATKYFPQTLLEAGVPSEIQAALSSSLSLMSLSLIRSTSEADLSSNGLFTQSLDDFFDIIGVSYALGVFENYQQTGFSRRNDSENVLYEYKPTNLAIMSSSSEASSVIEIENIDERFLNYIINNNIITSKETKLYGWEIPKEFNIGNNGEDYIFYPIKDQKNNVLGILAYQPRSKGYLSKTFLTSDHGDVKISDLVNIQLESHLRAFLERVMDSDVDMLTGLYNRNKAYELLQQGIDNELKKYTIPDANPERKLTLYYIDIDNFKSVNDTFGHAKGDIVLQRVSHQLKSAIRNPDYVSRLGGEELLVQGETKDGDGSFLAERLRKRVEELDFSDILPDRPHITISIGYAKFKNKGETPQKLINMADTALYFSKQTGKNRATNIKRISDLLNQEEYNDLRNDEKFREYIHH